MVLDYWYDHQLERLLRQSIRVFGGFQYQTGIGASGTTQLITVPVTIASTSSMVSSIIQNNSENVMLSCPQITVYLDSIELSAERRQAPNYVDNVYADERSIDPVTNTYTNQLGARYKVERLMPVPINATIKVDIWTSNLDQKFQLYEQIAVLFNPSIDLQYTTNPIDWTSITTMELTGQTLSSRSIPIGDTTSGIDVMTFEFLVPFWLTPPAKVKRQVLIQQIIQNIVSDAEYLGNVDETGNSQGLVYSESDLITRVITTPGNHQINVSGNTIQLLGEDGNPNDKNGNTWSWTDLLKSYGTYRPGISQLRLKTNTNLEDYDSDIVGSITIDGLNDNYLYWAPTFTSLPANTLNPINATVDPIHAYPGKGLPNAEIGQRYLMLEAIGHPTIAWGNLVCGIDDIVQYDGQNWTVVFDASTQTGTQYVTNLYSGKQFKWSNKMWVLSVDGQYSNGYWRLFL